MTPKWKADVRTAMALRGVSEQWLADQINARRGITTIRRNTINVMLKDRNASALVPDVCEILGLAPPLVATPQVPNDKDAKLIDLVLKLPDEEKDSLIKLLGGSRTTR